MTMLSPTRVVTYDSAQKMRVWDLARQKLEREFDGPRLDNYEFMVLHPDGKTVVLGCTNSPQLHYVDWTTGKTLPSPGMK